MLPRLVYLVYVYSGFDFHLTTWQNNTDCKVGSSGSSGHGCQGEGGEEEGELCGGDLAWLERISPEIREAYKAVVKNG